MTKPFQATMTQTDMDKGTPQWWLTDDIGQTVASADNDGGATVSVGGESPDSPQDTWTTPPTAGLAPGLYTVHWRGAQCNIFGGHHIFTGTFEV